ncbi:hypothetical protein [Lactobacillus bombicola]|uniref:hypothetical protein n=1 Tax=Lactobacillus bombicola TaxID=1505723 RepID=UPI00105728E2|nr:hypothetical protein [Lactobacillus bombicola]
MTKGLIAAADLTFFTIGTIYIRCIITCITFWVKNKAFTIQRSKISVKIFGIYAARAFLTLLPQIAYTLATSSSNLSIAWVFLNMTSLYSVFFGSIS